MIAANESAASSGKLGGANLIKSKHPTCKLAPTVAQGNFAAQFIARRYGLSLHLARVIATLANIGAVLS